MISFARNCGKEVVKRIKLLYGVIMMALYNPFKLYIHSGSDETINSSINSSDESINFGFI